MIIQEKQRFPRTDDKDLLYMIQVRNKYPAPPYNPHTDGSYNPADMIIDFHLNQSKKKMRKLCIKHALEPDGPKRVLMKRMYLHWRASKLWKGVEYYGYGKGYKHTRRPDCSCGYISVAEWEKIQKRKEDQKAMSRKFRRASSIRRFPREPIYRYPRLPKGEIMRYPR